MMIREKGVKKGNDDKRERSLKKGVIIREKGVKTGGR